MFAPNVLTVPSPSAVKLDIGRVVSLTSGSTQTCALTSDSRVFCWGADQTNYGRSAAETDFTPRPIAGAFSAVSAGQIHVCALDAGGRLRCWGDTILGALGIR